MDAGRCADESCGSSVHAQWFSHQMVEQTIMTSLNDVMRISHVIEGPIKGEAQPNLGSSAAAITVVWVFWHKC